MQVFKKAKELIDYTITITDNINYFPKKRRFTFVDRIQNLTLDIYTKLLRANETPREQIEQRKVLQLDVLADIKVLQFLIELSCSRGYIDKRQLGIWANKISDVKNLTAAWYKKTK